MADYILIVDDEPAVCFIIEEVLKTAGFEVASVQDGQACLRQVQRKCPRLLLIDLRMPRLSGARIVEMLKQDPVTEALPVIVISGSLEATSLGQVKVDGLLRKPFDIDVLLAEVNRVLAATAEQH